MAKYSSADSLSFSPDRIARTRRTVVPIALAARARRDSFVSCQPTGWAKYSTLLRVIVIASDIAASLDFFACFTVVAPVMLLDMTNRADDRSYRTERLGLVLRRVAAKLTAQRNQGAIDRSPVDKKAATPIREEDLTVRGKLSIAAKRTLRGRLERAEKGAPTGECVPRGLPALRRPVRVIYAGRRGGDVIHHVNDLATSGPRTSRISKYLLNSGVPRGGRNRGTTLRAALSPFGDTARK